MKSIRTYDEWMLTGQGLECHDYAPFPKLAQKLHVFMDRRLKAAYKAGQDSVLCTLAEENLPLSPEANEPE